MGRDRSKRRSGARRASLCRSGQTRHDGRAFHLSRRRPRPFQHHPGRRHASRRSIAAPDPSVAEGRTMNLLGKLTWSAIPFDQPIVMGASSMVGLAIAAILGLVTVKGWWPYLWREWITSVDHKHNGVMYF